MSHLFTSSVRILHSVTSAMSCLKNPDVSANKTSPGRGNQADASFIHELLLNVSSLIDDQFGVRPGPCRRRFFSVPSLRTCRSILLEDLSDSGVAMTASEGEKQILPKGKGQRKIESSGKKPRRSKMKPNVTL